MPIPLLTEEAIYPSEDILQAALGDIYPAFRQLSNWLAESQIAMEWRYYNDGKAWLCKCVHKKKTVLWLSAWEGYVQAGFFFTGKTCEGIPERLKRFEKNVGKLIPLVMKLSSEDQLDDLMTLVEYKKNLK